MCDIKRILEENKIIECSFANKFEIHRESKIDGISLVMSFFSMLLQGKNTLEIWAGEICKLTKHAISPQALQSRLQYRCVNFTKELLENSLKNILLENDFAKKSENILNKFNRVFLEDSTCIKLSKNMFEHFPGTVNQIGKTSTARVQFRMELKTGSYSNFELKSYRNNDQSYSGEILKVLKKNDLVIRDLGYWVLGVFEKIMGCEAFFITRYMYKTSFFDPNSGKKIAFFKKLRSSRRKKVNVLDMNVLVGKDSKIEMRLIAIRAPKEIEQGRRTKMRKDKLKNRSKDYLEMMGWTIYLTNIPKEKLSYKEINQLYGFRWRIEIIFKCWKSKFNMYRLLKNKNLKNPSRVYITMYLVFIWLTLFFLKKYNFYLNEIFNRKNKILSLFKFADYIKQNFVAIMEDGSAETIINYLDRYCCQQKRRRKSSIELIHMLNFT